MDPSAGADPVLPGSRGCGSAIVERAFALAGLPVEVEEIGLSAGNPSRTRLLAANPLGEVPVLLLPGGSVLTERLAIVRWLDGLAFPRFSRATSAGWRGERPSGRPRHRVPRRFVPRPG